MIPCRESTQYVVVNFLVKFNNYNANRITTQYTARLLYYICLTGTTTFDDSLDSLTSSLTVNVATEVRTSGLVRYDLYSEFVVMNEGLYWFKNQGTYSATFLSL